MIRGLLEEGLIEPPPAMVQAIGDWIASQVAMDWMARIREDLEGKVQRYIKYDTELSSKVAADDPEYDLEDARKRMEDRIQQMRDDYQARFFDKLQAYVSYPVREKKVTKPLAKKFPLDLTDWKYEDKIIGAAKEVVEERWPYITVVLDTQANKRGGLWSGHHGILKVSYDTRKPGYSHADDKMISPDTPRKYGGGRYGDGDWEVATIDKIIAKLKRILHHELIHMSQYILNKAIGYSSPGGVQSKPQPGMPSRSIMTPEFSQFLGSDIPKSRKEKYAGMLDRIEQSGVHPGELHTLDDIEFYTNLSDEVLRFKDGRKHGGWEFSGPIKQAAIKYVTGTKWSRGKQYIANRFFRTLKERSPAKWKKAVKEFMKAVLVAEEV